MPEQEAAQTLPGEATGPARSGTGKTHRDLRLDFFRGAALFFIFIDFVPRKPSFQEINEHVAKTLKIISPSSSLYKIIYTFICVSVDTSKSGIALDYFLLVFELQMLTVSILVFLTTSKVDKEDFILFLS